MPRTLLALACLVALVSASEARGTRVKDISSVKGVRVNQLIGYGLVLGLAGTGDKQNTEFTVQSLASVLGGMGIGFDPEGIQVKNVAAVMVTAELPPFSRAGAKMDAQISSIGDAKSIEGGTLAMTPLYGSDGEIYAIAQGPLSVGGFSARGGGSSVQKNHPTVGRLVNGATIERELPYSLSGKKSFQLALRGPDFTTALRMAQAINRRMGTAVASASDPGTVEVSVPDGYEGGAVGFMAAVETVDFDPDRVARVVVNERTGTVVMGEAVTISTVAVSHGSLSVTIQAIREVSQPLPFSDGETVEVENAEIQVDEEGSRLNLVGGPVTIDELIRGLNSMGVTPRDLISILQAIETSGALAAELELM